MKKVIFLLVILSLFFSCSINKKIDKIKPSINNECLGKLDSLSNIIKPIRYELYSVDLTKFSIAEFKGLNELELAINEIPFKEDEQRIFQFKKLLYTLTENKNCYIQFSKETLRSLLGQPTNISKDENIYEYLFYSGFNCPDCSVPIHRIFESCDYSRFYFNNDNLVNITFELYYTGLK
jgi:hypothetical protein